MNRDAGKAPEGSRVAIYSQEGKVPNQARPNWENLASDARTWDVLDTCHQVADHNNKTVAQVNMNFLVNNVSKENTSPN